jgi:hypothetical protein
MKLISAFVALAFAAFACAGCATGPLVPPSTQVVVLQTDTTIDAAYNTAAQAYLAAEPSLPAGVKAQTKAVLVQAYGYVQGADTAQRLGDAATFNAQFAEASALISQVKALLPTSK